MNIFNHQIDHNREFQTLFKKMMNGFIIIDQALDLSNGKPDYNCSFANDSFIHTLSKNTGNLIGKKVQDVWPNFHEEWIDHFNQVLTTGLPGNFVMYHQTSKKLFDCNIYRLSKSGQRFCVIFHEIKIDSDNTKRSFIDNKEYRLLEEKYLDTINKLLKEKVRVEKSEKRYKQLLNNLSAGIVVHDAQTNVLLNNDLAAELLGLTNDQLVGKAALDPCWHFFKKNGQVMPEEDFPVNLILKSKKPLSNYLMGSYQPKTKRKVWVLVDGYHVLDEKNEIKEVLISFIDFTEQKSIELKLIEEHEKTKLLKKIQRKESQISAILNNTNAIIISIDRKYKLIEFNAAYIEFIQNIFSKTPKPGDSILDYIFEDDLSNITKIYEQVFSGKYPTSYKNTITSLAGNEIFLEKKYNPIYVGHEIVAISIFLEDVTERVKHEKKLEKALKDRDFLLNEIHHRVKNNLSVVSSLLQLEELNSDNKEVKDILMSSQNRIKSTALVHQFLYQNENIQNLNFIEYVREFVKQASSLFLTHHNIDIKINGQTFLLDIELATPCGLILNELLTNSIKHAFDESNSFPLININLSKNETHVSIYYSDNGKGFDDKNLTKKSLGITIIKTLTKQIKGDYLFNNNNGSNFKLIFPIAKL